MSGTVFEVQGCERCNTGSIVLVNAPEMTIPWLAEHLSGWREVR